MSPRHHPDQGLLLEYAGGGAPQAVALAVATHLAFCAPCRDAVRFAESLGGALLEDGAPAPLSAAAKAGVLQRLDDPAPAPTPLVPTRDGTPSPLRAFLGHDLSEVSWRRIGPKLAYVPLQRRSGVAMRLLRGAPGADVGRHSHRAQEYTLVLAGGFSDETGSYGPGDFQAASPELTHNPVADPGEDCINLAVTTAPLRFEGVIPALAAKLFGF